MDSIGQKLIKTRKLKNLKISDVSKELRISEEILKNFEQGSDQNYFTWYGQKKDYNLNRVTYSKMLEKKY